MSKAGVNQVVAMKLTSYKTNAAFNHYSHIDKEIGDNAMGKLENFIVSQSKASECV